MPTTRRYVGNYTQFVEDFNMFYWIAAVVSLPRNDNVDNPGPFIPIVIASECEAIQ